MSLHIFRRWSQPTDLERTRAAGFDAHLVKPVALERLFEVVRAARPAEVGA